MAILIIELIAAVPTYYLIRAILKRKYVIEVATIACIVGLTVGWIFGYRVTKDIMVDHYLAYSKQHEIAERGTNLNQERWSILFHDFTSDPQNIMIFHIGAAKASVPPFVFVVFILIWLAKRQKKKNQIHKKQ